MLEVCLIIQNDVIQYRMEDSFALAYRSGDASVHPYTQEKKKKNHYYINGAKPKEDNKRHKQRSHLGPSGRASPHATVESPVALAPLYRALGGDGLLSWFID